MTDIGFFRPIGPQTILATDSDAEEWTEHRDLSLLRLRPADGVFDRVVLQKADESRPVSVFVFTEITGGDTTVGRLVFFAAEGNVFQFCRLDVDRPAVLEPQRVVYEPLESRHTTSQLSDDGRLLHVIGGQPVANVHTYDLEKKAWTKRTVKDEVIQGVPAWNTHWNGRHLHMTGNVDRPPCSITDLFRCNLAENRWEKTGILVDHANQVLPIVDAADGEEVGLTLLCRPTVAHDYEKHRVLSKTETFRFMFRRPDSLARLCIREESIVE
ncbi:hypothetical protein M3Y99_01744100 [Aphelenchoides fujianensis]|nr:hypothetical protein M3Y99_01744100 [Aphelenchoides fujianensis]